MPSLLPTDRESLLLAPYAARSDQSAGRRYAEGVHPYRSAFQRDRDRITHCAAFRRLSHKTQVFTGESGDYHRSRLTHTLEVASIARTMARALALNEDLVEALALLHDIGHPPFGHAGEDVLDERLSEHGGFNHNAQALRIVERLEIRYPRFPGLNLSAEVLEGQHRRANKTAAFDSQPLLEVQVVDAADSIAYDAHDADDALELGLLTLDDLAELTLWREAAERVGSRYEGLTNLELRRAVIHELIDAAVSRLVEAAEARIKEFSIASVDDVRSAPPLLEIPPELAEKKRQLQGFLFRQVYRHPEVIAQREVTNHELGHLFDYYLAHPVELPTFYHRIADEEGLPRAVADWLSSHTDRSAREAFAALSITPT
jgi:dGTPase